jgi:hypothetical protein
MYGYAQETRENVRNRRSQTLPIHLQRHVLYWKTYGFVHPLSLKDAFRARLPSETASWTWPKKKELRVRFPSKTEKQMQPQLVKTKLLCETSLLWDFFAVRLLLLWNFFALRLLCSETPLLWDFLRNSVPLKYRLPNFTWQISICFFGMLFASWRAQKIKVSNLFCFATSVACRKSIGTCGIVGMLYGRAW